MQSCNGIPKVWVGVVSLMAIVWMLPWVQIYSKCGFPSGPGLKLLLFIAPWIEVAFGVAQVKQFDRGLGSAIDMSLQDMWPAWRLGGLPAPRLPVAA